MVNELETRILNQVTGSPTAEPKNGFFYVLDRVTGEFISAKPYVPVNWATHIDPESGRPVETPNARYQANNPFQAMDDDEKVTAINGLSDEELEVAFAKPSPQPRRVSRNRIVPIVGP